MIYLDNNATTRVAEAAVQAMLPYLREHFANASSAHRPGQAARHGVETARRQVAALVGAEPREIIFTSGGTEADNLAILGTLAALPGRRHVVMSAVEHAAVYELGLRLREEGYRVTFVPVDGGGRLDLEAFEKALDEETAIASVMYANNETGVLLQVEEAARLAAGRGVWLHVDAVQALGKVEIDVRRLGAALVSFSSHKVHGPKGVGALYVGRGVRLRNRQVGGHQERELRPGTENVPGIVGFGAAAELAGERLKAGLGGVAALRDRLEEGLLERIPQARVIGDRRHRLVNTCSMAFVGMQGDAILVGLSEAGLCASAGSACASGSLEPSHVLKAMNVDRAAAHGVVRFSLSVETTAEEIDQALEIVPRVARRLAALGPPGG